MHGPWAVGWLLVAVCAVTGVSCLLRARGASGPRRRAAGSEAVMGFGMAAMALPPAVLGPLPPALLTVAFSTLFATLAAVELAQSRTSAGYRGRGHPRGHHLHHAVGALAMVYMTLAMAAPGASGHHGAAGFAPLTGALLVYFAGYVLALGLRLVPSPAGAPAGAVGAASAAGWPHAVDAGARPSDGAREEPPVLAAACRLAMGTGMFAMLLTM